MLLIPEALPKTAPLLVEPGRVWSVAELRQAVSAAADELRARDAAVAFCFCRNDATTVVAYLAALEAGCATLLVDAGLSADLVSSLARRYRPDWLLAASPAAAGACDAGAFDVVTPSTGPALHRRKRRSEVAPHPDLALMLSTSGSTGSAKLVRLTRRAVEHNARAIADTLGIDEHDRPIASLPLHYSYGLSVLNSHLARGACVVLTAEPLTSKAFWEAFRAERCTSLAGVPYTYQILRRLDLEKLDVPSLTTLTQAGGKLDEGLVRHYAALMARRGGRFFVMDGQTEATARIAVLPATEVREKPGAAGRALPGGTLRIDVDGTPRAPGEIGEVLYRGPNVMMGYAESREDLARGDDLGGELRTGDLGYLDPDGDLFITGRSKRIAKVYGLRINLDEVEAMLTSLGSIAVLGGTDALLVYCEDGDDDLFAEQRRMLAEKLHIHHQAIAFERVASLPRTANGKVDYQGLAERR